MVRASLIVPRTPLSHAATAAEVVFGISMVEECKALVVAARRLAAARMLIPTGQTLGDRSGNCQTMSLTVVDAG